MDREIVLRQTLGDLSTSIKLEQIPAAFGLAAGSNDRRMLRFVPAALRFRRALRNGDSLPGEIFDGRPSWAPKPHHLARAVRRLGAAIGADALPEADGANLFAAFEDLARIVRGHGLTGETRLDADDIAQIASDAARVDWLCRAVVAVQQCLGELVQTASSRHIGHQADAARTTARGLRDAVVWASARALAADQIVADAMAAFRDAARFRGRLWPLVAALRAFALDIEPLTAQWREARARRGGPSAQDLESMLRLVSIRLLDFDPKMFDLAEIRKSLPSADAGNEPLWGNNADAE